MTPFSIAGIQMHIGHHNNVEAMEQRLDLLMHLYPWVEMVLFSELAPFGATLQLAQTLPGPAEEAFQEMAKKHQVWLLPGSMFEKRDGLIYCANNALCPASHTAAVVKATCTAVLGSAATLMQ